MNSGEVYIPETAISRRGAKSAKKQHTLSLLDLILCDLCAFARGLSPYYSVIVSCILLLSTFIISTDAKTQNLIPNPGFEDPGKCLGFNTIVNDWRMPAGTFYHYLSDCPVGKSQYDGEEYNAPYSGKCLAGICLYPNEMREYITVPLTEQLRPGEEYIFSGFISLASEKHIDYQNFAEFEVAFTSREYYVERPTYIFLEPQLRIPVSFVNREMEWIYIHGKFRAKGDEQFLLMGDFLPEVSFAAQMETFSKLPSEEQQIFLKRSRSFENSLNELKTYLANTTDSYSIRCYLDEICLMPAADTLKGLCNYPVRKPVASAEPPKPIVLKNIFFETAKSTLLPASFTELDSLAGWLRENPGTEIQISGHTDNKGNEKDNLKLSSDRAASVKNYLFSKGCTNTMNSRGYGSTVPVTGNENEDGRKKNRRVEFLIIKK